MDLDSLFSIIDKGQTPIFAGVLYLMWRLDKKMGEFIAKIDGQQEGRDAKLNSIHSDIGDMIRRLAGLKNGG